MTGKAPAVEHEESARRGAFRIGDYARMTYRRRAGGVMVVDHTVVDESRRGEGLAHVLYDALIAFARAEDRRIVPQCPFVAAMFQRNPEHADLLA